MLDHMGPQRVRATEHLVTDTAHHFVHPLVDLDVPSQVSRAAEVLVAVRTLVVDRWCVHAVNVCKNKSSFIIPYKFVA